ncbi:protein of unknown function [Cognatiyoonia sediminum]|uniref:DUF4169 domain-containing protein n=1 Tax=Cognatiyoonia sediminum TaxID=1508389 RepID=A0A1M5LW44_9RHOB|nr:DUF4169 family protein [Cognatiyoonia sediminum]SHG69226.1 protein of unknown function [Cognatiyoonia sediminum]
MKPINLNKARKAKARDDAKARANKNAVKYGRTKAQRLLEATQQEQASKRLSELKFEDE